MLMCELCHQQLKNNMFEFLSLLIANQIHEQAPYSLWRWLRWMKAHIVAMCGSVGKIVQPYHAMGFQQISYCHVLEIPRVSDVIFSRTDRGTSVKDDRSSAW